jgi:hypothetical protein
MVVTRYSLANFALLGVGTLLCPLVYFPFMMGWGNDNPGFQAACGRLFPLPELLSIPAFLIAYRWSGIACLSLWILAGCGALLALTSGNLREDLLPIIVQLVITFLATGAFSNSQERQELAAHK